MKVTGRAHGVMVTQAMPETIVPVEAALFFGFILPAPACLVLHELCCVFFFCTLGPYFITIHFIFRCFSDVMRMLTLSLALTTPHNALQDKNGEWNGMLHTMSPAFPFAHDKVIHGIYCQSKSLFCYVAQIYWILYRCRFLSIIYLFVPDDFWMLFVILGMVVRQQVFVEALLCLLFFVCMFRKCYTLHDSSV